MAVKTRPSSIDVDEAKVSAPDVATAHQLSMSEANKTRKDCKKELMHAEKVEVSISPLYANQFSDNMCVSINGYTIYVPCDGQKYLVARPFADIIYERIARADEKARVQDRMANVQSNFEQFAGANNFIKRA